MKNSELMKKIALDELPDAESFTRQPPKPRRRVGRVAAVACVSVIALGTVGTVSAIAAESRLELEITDKIINIADIVREETKKVIKLVNANATQEGDGRIDIIIPIVVD